MGVVTPAFRTVVAGDAGSLALGLDRGIRGRFHHGNDRFLITRANGVRIHLMLLARICGQLAAEDLVV